MAATIIHMFEGVRPFDWLMLTVEVFVVLLILYEVIVGERHRRADDRRRIFINEKMVPLSLLLDKGRRIQTLVPDQMIITDMRSIQQWIADVQSWTHETNSFLAPQSPKAVADFMNIADVEKVSVFVVPAGRQFYMTGECGAPTLDL